jgi:hypothetical protein
MSDNQYQWNGGSTGGPLPNTLSRNGPPLSSLTLGAPTSPPVSPIYQALMKMSGLLDEQREIVARLRLRLEEGGVLGPPPPETASKQSREACQSPMEDQIASSGSMVWGTTMMLHEILARLQL